MELTKLQEELVEQMIRCGVTENGPVLLTGLSHSEQAELSMLNFIRGFEKEHSILPTEAHIIGATDQILDRFPSPDEAEA